MTKRKMAGVFGVLHLGLALSAPIDAQLRGNLQQFWHAGIAQVSANPTVTIVNTMARGDFNGDGYEDLAVGASTAYVRDPVTLDELHTAGVVHVFFGGPMGLSASGYQKFSQASNTGVPGNGDRYGAALAAGNFDNDAYDDLIVGAPYDDDSGEVDAGAIHILLGSANGLFDSGLQWNQATPGIDGLHEQGDAFGTSLAVGNFNGDLYDDLAVGSADEAVGALIDAGAVNILYGSAGGLTTVDDQMFDLDDTVGAEEHDRFGVEMVVGNFDGDPYDDLAIATTGREIFGVDGAGAVSVLYGGTDGLTTTGAQWLHQGIITISDAPEPFDRFGLALASGNFDGDAYDDLVIGVEESEGAQNTGAAHVIFGSPSGLDLTFDEFLHQELDIFNDQAESADRFAAALAVADFDGDGNQDLAVGAPGENWLIFEAELHQARGIPTGGPGRVNIIFGTGSGLAGSMRDVEVWDQDSPGVAGDPAMGENFGNYLLAGDFNGDGRPDLAVGIPGDTVEPEGIMVGHGSVVVLSSDIFSDGFDSGGLPAWSTTMP